MGYEIIHWNNSFFKFNFIFGFFTIHKCMIADPQGNTLSHHIIEIIMDEKSLWSHS